MKQNIGTNRNYTRLCFHNFPPLRKWFEQKKLMILWKNYWKHGTLAPPSPSFAVGRRRQWDLSALSSNFPEADRDRPTLVSVAIQGQKRTGEGNSSWNKRNDEPESTLQFGVTRSLPINAGAEKLHGSPADGKNISTSAHEKSKGDNDTAKDSVSPNQLYQVQLSALSCNAKKITAKYRCSKPSRMNALQLTRNFVAGHTSRL